MRYCPHCRKPTAKTSGACPHCGLDLDAEASTAAESSGAYSAITTDEVEEDAPLELDTAYTPTPEPYPYEPNPTPLPAGAVGDVGLDAGPGTPVPTPRPTPAPTFGGAPVLPALSPDEDKPIEFPPEDLEDLAQFGPPPSSIVQAVSYAFSVRRRSAELLAEAERLGESLETARKELVEALARLGERARVAGYRTKLTAPLLAEVAAAEHDAESADAAAVAERSRHAKALAEIEAKLDALRRRMEEPRLRESKLAAKLAELEGQRRQLEAEIKRTDSEIQKAEQALLAADEAEDDPEAAARNAQAAEKARQRLPKLRAAIESLRARNAQLETPLADARAELADARAELAELKAERAGLHAERDEENKRHAEFTERAHSQSKEAKEFIHNKLAEIGRAVRLESEAPDWASELFPPIDAKALAFAKLREKTQLHRQAAEAYDHDAVRRGYLVLAVAGSVGIILVVTLLLVLMLSGD